MLPSPKWLLLPLSLCCSHAPKWLLLPPLLPTPEWLLLPRLLPAPRWLLLLPLLLPPPTWAVSTTFVARMHLSGCCCPPLCCLHAPRSLLLPRPLPPPEWLLLPPLLPPCACVAAAVSAVAPSWVHVAAAVSLFCCLHLNGCCLLLSLPPAGWLLPHSSVAPHLNGCCLLYQLLRST